MKRRYKVAELIEETTIDDSILSTSDYLSIIQSVMKPITGTDGQSVDSELYDFIAYFSTSYNWGINGHMLDKTFGTKFGDMVTVRKYDSVSEALFDVQERSSAVLLSKVDDLARLYYALNLSYNPLYNKDATEILEQTGDITDTHTGDDDTGVKGTVQDATTNSSSGKRNGQTLMESKVVVEESTVPYDNTTHYDIDKSETTTPVMGTDTTASNEVDYHNKTEYNSSIEHSYDKTDTKRSFGNLGVTKSTDLLESEFTMRQKNSFWRYVYDLCLKDQLMREVALCEY